MRTDHVFADLEDAAERYLLGEMSDADREKYEQHFFSCDECQQELRTTAAFLDDVREQVTPAAKAASDAERRKMAERGKLADRGKIDAPRGWFAFKPLFWPLPAGAALAASLLVAVVAYESLLIIPGLRRELADERTIQNAPEYFLSASRGEEQAIALPAGQTKITVRLSGALDPAFPFYRVEMRDRQNQVVDARVLPALVTGDELRLSIPTATLTPGDYSVSIAWLASADGQPSESKTTHYYFSVRREGSTTAGTGATRP